MVQFPHDFLWGAATSAYQVEGNNIHNDWWNWEKGSGLKEVSGLACRHYELYREDFDLAKQLNHNCHRLSIEWSRIEPKEGEFSQEEINHYIDVVMSLRQRGIEPIVTLHHFTNPLWFIELGGWQNKNAYSYFCRYVIKVVEALCDRVNYWVTINEPLVYTYYSYVAGLWPPEVKSFFKARKVANNFILAHIKAYRVINDIYNKKSYPKPLISIAANIQDFIYCSPTLKNKIAVYLRNRLFNFGFIDKLIQHKSLDFIGINYYTRALIDIRGWGLNDLLLANCTYNHSRLQKNSMGWDIYPEGLYNSLLKLKRYNLPVFILENGICTDNDNIRWEFISQHLKCVYRAIRENVNVLGYVYWALIDNFEWDKGFGPRFGLIEIDYNNYKRTIRESAKKLSLVCRTGQLLEDT